jgi:hypothetical protein
LNPRDDIVYRAELLLPGEASSFEEQTARFLALEMAPGDSIGKRKRGGADHGARRPSPAARAGASSTLDDHSAAFDDSGLREIIAHNNGTHATSNGPSTTGAAETAAAALDSSLTHYQVPASFEPGAQQPNDPNNIFSLDHAAAFGLDPLKDSTNSPHEGQSTSHGPPSGSKPAVGSDEWHRIRRDNHKEVERRRREAINEGINELSKIVPGCEKNKGSILQRAVQYIGQLKENEQQNIEKWTLEKLLLDQAITELSATADRLKNDTKFYQRERDIYKRACDEHSIVPEGMDKLENESKASTDE